MKPKANGKLKLAVLIFIVFVLSAIALQWQEIYFYLVPTQQAKAVIKKQSHITSVQGDIVFDSSRDWKPWSDRAVYLLRRGVIEKILPGSDSSFISKTNSVLFLNSRGVHVCDLLSSEITNLKIHVRISTLSGYDVSPDGGRIVFVDGKYDKHGATINNLYIINMDGTGLKQVTFFDGEYFMGQPRWHPDGKRILFNKGDSDRKKPSNWTGVEQQAPSLYAINADGTGLENLLQNTDAFGWHGSWSRDGRRIAFILLTELGLNQIAILDIDTGTVRQITSVPSLKEIQMNPGIRQEFKEKVDKGYPIYKDYPVFSPDDKQIAFIGKSRGGYFSGSELFVVGVDGGEIQRLTAPHWTRQGWAEINSFDWAA